MSEKFLSKEYFPSVKEKHNRECLNKQDMHKYMRPQVLRELDNVIARLLSVIFKRSWQLREPLVDRKQANINPSFKRGNREDLENYRPVSLTLISGR